jgi:hypothetical protein
VTSTSYVSTVSTPGAVQLTVTLVGVTAVAITAVGAVGSPVIAEYDNVHATSACKRCVSV